MQLTTADAMRIMEKLRVDFRRCDHHIRGFVTVDGKRVLAVHCSFGKKDMPGSVPHRFRKSLKLASDEFAELARCHMDREHYIAILRQRGVLD